MKTTLSWLKDYLDTDADLATIGKTLTAIGLEVESIQNSGE
jgi:phenylalanyl-tRNA synthetase beta chain